LGVEAEHAAAIAVAVSQGEPDPETMSENDRTYCSVVSVSQSATCRSACSGLSENWS
jgi:hypothetical protein